MKHINTRIPLIGLFILLALMSLLLTLYSAKIYDNLTQNNSENNTAFVTAMYITEKIKRTPGAITIDSNKIILQNENTKSIIYLYQNGLYETLIYADKQLTPGSGELLFQIQEIDLLKTDNLLRITVMDLNGNNITKRLKIIQEDES